MATLQEVAQKFNVSPEQVESLRSAMSRTWSQVCYDYMDCFEGGEQEAYAAFGGDESALVAEATIDADRITTFCPDMDLGWVYKLDDGSWRSDCMEMAQAAYTAR